MKLAVMFKLIIGFLALLLAAVGLLLPVWPTTPFVLLAIGCFSGTPRLRRKLLAIPFFREYYESYTAGTGVCRKTITVSLVFLWGMLAVSIMVTGSLWINILLLIIGSAVTLHILLISRGGRKPR